MALSLYPLCSLILISTLAICTSLHHRQDFLEDIPEYAKQVRTAIYVIENLRAGNASDSCADAGLVEQLDLGGYDGAYCHGLLCEAAIGIEIFSDLERASGDMRTTLEGLSSAQSGENASDRCQMLNVNTLNEAGLDGASIRSAICGPTDSTSSTPSTAGTTTTSSQSAIAFEPTATAVTSLSEATSSSTPDPETEQLSTPTLFTSTSSESPSTSVVVSTSTSSSSLSPMDTTAPTTTTTLTSPSSSISEQPISVSIITVTVYETVWVGQASTSEISSTTANPTTSDGTSQQIVDITATINDPSATTALKG
ncbi:hypothetical protein LTR37_008703 [Vermiconidia calcicola]|uniref:Uncharacterized protein n=1 Tax=Vermiconidia calcicola TaxID=1690605 RepID=A0ACC3NB82_9PEZI|nr:hypothetical protein LTR37_008703 [Vermiconidia calcicola]